MAWNLFNLFKYDSEADADDTFNIDEALNDNWDAIKARDAEVTGRIDAADELISSKLYAERVNGRDLNNILTEGFYSVSSGTTNAPLNIGGSLLVFPWVASTADGAAGSAKTVVTQMFISISIDPRIFVRTNTNGTPSGWTEWKDSTYNSILTANTIVYVATTGNDATGDGTEGNPFATITKALSVIPKNLNGHNATVSIGAGSYNEDVFCNYFTGGLLYFSLLGNVTINSFEANYCPSIGIGGAYTLTSGHITAMLSSISASSLTNITISNSITFGGAPGVGLGGDRATVYFSGTVTFTGNQTNAVFVLNNAQIYVGTVTGTVTTGFRSLSGGKITFSANSLSASTNYVTSTGGRIYSGAQTNTPNY